MKRLLLIVILLNSFFLFSQEDVFGSSPVQGIIPIKRGETQEKNTSLNRVVNNTSVIEPASPTGNSTEVGVTEGQLSVSLTGGATYNIPIAVPPGINGIVPQIFLSYNSQGGNGLAGYGWNISGVSVITKIPSTRFHDDNIDAVDFDGLDRYAFDGQRLVVKNGTTGVYGANGTVYETESFSNVQITSYGVHPNGANFGPEYFIVEYPDGSIAYYGSTNNSKSLTDWAISYWQNPQGVRISYEYILFNNNLSISSIKYGARLEEAAINEISFIYKNRVRSEQAYIGGQSFIRNTILSEIKVKGNNVGFRNYLLAHETTSLGYERLKSITEKSGDNSKSFNPTIFIYEDTEDDVTFNLNSVNLSVNNIRTDNSSTIQGDFDGDGKMDFILYPTTGSNAKKKYWLFTDIEGSGMNIGSEHNIGDFVDIFPSSWLNHTNKLMPQQGWFVVQNNIASGITSFRNYSAGIANPIYFQYERIFEFPKLAYTIECPNLIHCDLVPSNNINNRDRDLIIDPDPFDPGPIESNCAEPINVNLTPILNNQTTLSWDEFGTISPLFWEVHYFETTLGSPPSNSDSVGTYIQVNDIFLVIDGLNARKNYSFYIRAVCSFGLGYQANNWVGPFSMRGLINNPVETMYKDIPKEFISGDFNGDGLTDVIAIEKSTSYQTRVCQGDCYTTTSISVTGGRSYFVNLDRRLTENFVNNAGTISITNGSKFIVADVNGDGKSDLMVFDSGVVKVYNLNNSNQLVLFATLTDSNIKTDKPILMGDYNGDGKADFIIPKENLSNIFTKYYSTGFGFVRIEENIGIDSYFTGSYDGNLSVVQYIIPNDFNNDGKTDLVLAKAVYQVSGELSTVQNRRFISVMYYKNNGINFESSVFTVKSDFNGLNHFPVPVFLSFDKANSNREISFISNNNIYTAISPKDNKIETTLKEIILGNGVKDVITYSQLNNNCESVFNCDSPFEPSTYTEDYPNFDIKQANSFHVVSKIEQISATQSKQQKFKYYGAVSNVEGLGFLGFRGLSRTNWFNDDFPEITSVTKHDINKRGAISESYSVLGEIYGNFTNYTPTNFINKSNMTYVDELLTNKVYKINNTFTISTNGLEGTSKEASTTFDSNNNPLSTTSISKNGTAIERTETVDIEYFPTTTSPIYIVGRLKRKNSTVTHNGDTMTGEEVYTYNAAHLISKIQKKGHLTNYLTEDNIYDVFGNITQKKITAVGLTPRTTNFTYDTTGRFLLTSTDIEGLVTTYTYNTSNGLLLTQTLPSNAGHPLKTTYLYDAWGKKTKEIDYLGKSLNYSYSWLSAGTNGFFGTSSSGDDNSATFSWFDDLGRKIAEGFRTINDASSSESNNSWKTFEYDIYDRVKKSFEPKLSLLPKWEGLYSTTEFDAYGRTTQVVEYTGKTSTINYNGLSTIASDGVSNTTVVKNSLGNIVSNTDNGGTINYQYYANGNLKESNFEGVIVAIEQDGWGRKTKLIDPSAGTYSYEYNEFGETTKEITPKGETNFTIDDFGKVIEKTIIGTGGDPTNTKTTYTYDSTTKLLTNTRYDDFTGGFYTLYTYGYDNYKRLNFSDESGFNAYYQRATQFDSFGRPEKELYTAINTADSKRSDKWVKNTYKNGHHWQILDDATNQVLWQTSKVNARGQLINANYGNNIHIHNTYDQYGYITQFRHRKTDVVPNVEIMTLNTTFEQQRGNLISRYNSMFDYREDFTYDDLDRLTSWTNNNELFNFTFTNTIEGFIATNSNVLITNETVSGNDRLKVTSNSNDEGTQRIVKTNAIAGEVIEIKGQLFFRNPIGETYYVKYSIIERDPISGLLNEIPYGVNSGINFTFQHTVSQYSEISLKVVVGNPFNFQAPISFSLDNVKVIEIKTSTQAYDILGRINENNVGTYNYTNVNPSNSVPKHFQNSSIETNSEYSDYYLGRANLDITYNAFKSPIDIIEEGKDKLSFIYNMYNSRSTMYYGSLEADKLSRRYRKHYSADGSMEIKQDMFNSTVEFITYIGGDAYSAPIILKSDGTTQNYLYLHRDYLGSIVAITNQQGEVEEKRLFDAWGNISKVQDGNGNILTRLTVIDRGYTGHEHLQGVNLIHMNGRLYDPVIHRFLQPDNFIQDPLKTQNYNRYSYVWNNPLKYNDKSGEWVWAAVWVGVIVGAAAGGAAYIATAIQTGNWSWGGFGMSILSGAIIGGITGGYGSAATAVTSSAVGNAAASSFAAAFFPAISVPVGDWSFSISPSIAFGNASGAGLSFGVSYSEGDWNFSGGVGIMSYGNYNGFGANANEIRYSILANYDDGKTGFSLGTNFWRGDFNQRTTYLGARNGDFRFGYENDGSPFSYAGKALSNNTDMYRTAAASIGIGDFDLQLNMFTGKSGNDIGQGRDNDKNSKFVDFNSGRMKGDNKLGIWKNPEADAYRLGALSVGYRGYKVGVNSEHVRDAFQNWFAHKLMSPQPGFRMLSNTWDKYFQYNTPMINKSTLW